MRNKVILILVDGMRPDALINSKNNHLVHMKQTSSHCFHSTSIVPSVTLPCHTSLFLSVDPDRHGITTNTWTPQVRPINSIIDAASAAGLKTAMFYNWEFLRDLNKPGSLNFSYFKRLSLTDFAGDLNSEIVMTDKVLEYIDAGSPDLTFIYFGLLDEAGHHYGWMSEEYMQALDNAQNCIYRIRQSLPSEYNIIITADHGGHEKTHGTEMPEDMTIPMIFNGSCFEENLEYDNVNLKDIAPTIAEILGIRKEPEWIGNVLKIKE